MRGLRLASWKKKNKPPLLEERMHVGQKRTRVAGGVRGSLWVAGKSLGAVPGISVLWAVAFLVMANALTGPAGATEHDLCLDGGAAPPLAAPEFLYSYRPGVMGPARLAVDSQDNIYVTDPAKGQLVVRAPDGRLLARRKLETPTLSIDIDDGPSRPFRAYLGNAVEGSVTAFDAEWNQVLALGQGAGEFALPNDIAIDPESGNIYVVDSAQHLVKVFAPGGVLINSFGGRGGLEGEFDFPAAIFVDDVRGEVLVADQLNFRVQIFDLTGNFICRLGDAAGSNPGSIFGVRARLFTVPQGLWVDSLGRIFIADSAEGRIRVADRDGTILGEIGQFGQVAGSLRVPLDIVLDSFGRLFVADSNNARLALFGVESFSDPEAFAPAVASIEPNPFDHQDNVGPFTASIEVAGYPLEEVVLTSIAANGVPTLTTTPQIGDQNLNGIPDLQVMFERSTLAATLPASGSVDVVLQGEMASLGFHALVPLEVTGGVLDSDGDGVLDTADACPGTVLEATVDGDGCSILQLCPCAGPSNGQVWNSHGDLVACRGDAARTFAEAGLIGTAEIGGIVRAAAKGSCGGGS